MIIGHADGDPRDAQQGSVDGRLAEFLKEQSVRFGDIYFTGDMLPSPSQEWFTNLKRDMSEYSGEIYAVPGNHDSGFSPNADHSIFLQAFGMTYPAIIVKEAATFLLVDTIEHPWAITPEAIGRTLNNAGSTNTLFILANSILRPNPTEIENPIDGIPDPLPHNLSLITPLREAYAKVIVISGNTGAFGNKPAVERRDYQNVTFVSQGLGVNEGIILAVRDDQLFTLPINE
ncbi:MAG: hypothetical protein P8L66_05250 [Rhodospirillaceae bacterium]|nr:hypothetical protein [Rhodospirillaceae bacterium]